MSTEDRSKGFEAKRLRIQHVLFAAGYLVKRQGNLLVIRKMEKQIEAQPC